MVMMIDSSHATEFGAISIGIAAGGQHVEETDRADSGARSRSGWGSAAVLAVALVLGLAAVGAPRAVAGPAKGGEANRAELVLVDRTGALMVANADGSAAAGIGVSGARPTFASVGSGTTADPFVIVYESALCQLSRVSVALVNGKPVNLGVQAIATPTAGNACVPATSPAGYRIAFGEMHTDNPPSSIWTVDGTGTEVSLYDAGNGDIAAFPTYSGDGSRIAFVESSSAGSSAATLVVMNADGSSVTKFAVNTYARFLKWSPNTNELVFTDGGGRNEAIYLVRLNPFVIPEKLVTGHVPNWNANGSGIYYTTGTSLNLLDLATRKSSVILRGPDYASARR
jgi:Tol biopolymer transport system component